MTVAAGVSTTQSVGKGTTAALNRERKLNRVRTEPHMRRSSSTEATASVGVNSAEDQESRRIRAVTKQHAGLADRVLLRGQVTPALRGGYCSPGFVRST